MGRKIIHYFWFGGTPLPEKARRCIASWSRFLPGHRIRRWDESNFDVDCNRYVREAYRMGKWAFVSDYARFRVLEELGGLYFDTDVEVVRPMDDLLELEAFAGFEVPEAVAPGLVLYSREPHHPLMQEAVDWYDHARFLDDQGRRIRINVCGVFTDILKRHGLEGDNRMQVVRGMTIFPTDYFNPFDDATGLLHRTGNTYAIHWYDKSWMPWPRRLRNRLTRLLHRMFGKDLRSKLSRKERR